MQPLMVPRLPEACIRRAGRSPFGSRWGEPWRYGFKRLTNSSPCRL